MKNELKYVVGNDSLCVQASCNTMGARAFTVLLAQIFGVKRVIVDSSGDIVTLKYWWGKYYMTNWTEVHKI